MYFWKNFLSLIIIKYGLSFNGSHPKWVWCQSSTVADIHYGSLIVDGITVKGRRVDYEGYSNEFGIPDFIQVSKR